MGHCHIDSGIPLAWTHEGFATLNLSLLYPSLAVALLRDHQEVWSQLVLRAETDGRFPFIHICLLTGGPYNYYFMSVNTYLSLSEIAQTVKKCQPSSDC